MRSGSKRTVVSNDPTADIEPVLDPQRFSRDVLAALARDKRNACLRHLEAIVNPTLQPAPNLAEFQRRLYLLIERLESLGHLLGRWDYDSEIEIWGGPSYMDPTLEDELLLRSEFQRGIRLAWKNYDELLESDPG